MENIIEISELKKYYGKSRGIEDVSFNVKEGEIFGFIGPNGAGKSTTIRTLLALIYPDSGKAEVFGKDCIKYAPKIAERIGYLPSEVFYYDGMKVKDLLEYSASFYKRDCKDKTRELVERLELDINRRIDDLSYGNKKKVGIVQGLLHSPDLIILDEPTSGLDPLMQQKFFEILLEENKRGATVLMSSHILGEVQKLCSRVAIIRDGKIVKVNKISDLKEESYKKIKIHAEHNLDSEMFNLPGINNLIVNGDELTFIYKGDINEIIQKVSKIKLISITIVEPDLEEIFMYYYQSHQGVSQ